MAKLTSWAVLVLVGCLPPPPDGAEGGATAVGADQGGCGAGSWRPGWLEIHHIDAGEAVSTLVVGPTGMTLLIDVGEASWAESDGADIVGAYARGVMGCKHLDYVLLSHFHLDHAGFPGYGGLWHLVHVQGFTVGRLLHRDLFRLAGAASTTLTSWRTYLQGAGGRVLHPEIATLGSSQIALGGGVTFTIVAVDGSGVLPAADLSNDVAPPDENDYSIAAVLRMGRLDYVTAGDLSGETLISSQGYSYHDLETSLAPRVKDADILRVSHHGSSHASNPTFLAQLAARVSIIQVADGNGNDHPSQTTIDRLLSVSRLYLTEHGNPRTDLRGARVLGHVVVRTANGIEYTVGDDHFVATDPTRIDADDDGYYAEADPDDGSCAVVPSDYGACDGRYVACP